MHYGTIKKCDIANGEGVRVSLFVSGCRNYCKNCFNKETWDFNYGKEFNQSTIDEIIKALSPNHINGLTILGGEPFEEENQKDLLPFIKKVRETYPNKTIWMYSGYLYDSELLKGKKNTPYTLEILKNIDILVDGRFVEELYSLNIKFRGSSNQRIIDVQKSLKENKVVLSPLNEKRQFKPL